MNAIKWALAIASGAAIVLIAQPSSSPSERRLEYVTIRWGGRDNTHLIRPSGKVEFIGPELRKIQKPDRTDERSFYLNIAINSLTGEGYEVVAMTTDEVLLKRFRR